METQIDQLKRLGIKVYGYSFCTENYTQQGEADKDNSVSDHCKPVVHRKHPKTGPFVCKILLYPQLLKLSS
jgi:hypothetical protein